MANIGPSQIIIIRHGEKLGDPKKDDDGGSHLSIRGSARAAALPSLFVPALPQTSCKLHARPADLADPNGIGGDNEAYFIGDYQPVPIKGDKPRFPAPNFIFATKKSKHSDRPVETVTPLGTALSHHIHDGFADTASDITEMANAILKEAGFAGKIVLICWHHGKIPAVAKALGIKKPPKWDGKVFDRVWQITFPKGKATLADLPQMLLYGDSKK